MKRDIKNIYIIILIILSLSGYFYQEFYKEKEIGTEQIQGVESNNESQYKVLKVIDGDTVQLETIGKVRLIGVDTPETVDPRKEVQCYGKEASEYTKSRLLNNYVRIEYDQTQDSTDRYGRHLVYIYLGEKNFNLELIENGYAYEYTYKVPYKYQREFKEAQTNAKETKQGLWGDICN